MNVTIVAVDKLREPYLKAGCELFKKRLAPYVRTTTVEVRPASGADALTAEGRDILGCVGADAIFWALDRSGTPLSSLALARKIGKVEHSGSRRLILAIGGAAGLHRSVLDRAAFVWSLSDLTFLHEMSRLIVLEQIYRAVKINRGEPYHR
jgi:23S rRNA (pseudouridine1915-N3)-methyltransferase